MTNFFENNFFKKAGPDRMETELEELDSNRETANQKVTPKILQFITGKAIEGGCSEFKIDGLEKIKAAKEKYPDRKFIVAAAHMNVLDPAAAIKALGPEFNLQMTGESVLINKLKYFGNVLMLRALNVFDDRFTPLDYQENDREKYGVFNPDNFTRVIGKMEEGRTPWMAINHFSRNGTMRRAHIGPVYLAHKTNSVILPTALELAGGGSLTMEGTAEKLKNFKNKSRADYHIADAIDLPPLDVSIIDQVFAKRKAGETVTEEEKQAFAEVHKALKEQADSIGRNISELLPEEKRGYYEPAIG